MKEATIISFALILGVIAVITVTAADDETCGAPKDFAGGRRRAGSRRRPQQRYDDSEGSEAVVGDGSVPADLLMAIRCPACDYTASYLINKALAAHRRCALSTQESVMNSKAADIDGEDGVDEAQESSGCVSMSTELSGTPKIMVASKRVIGQIYDTACTLGVLKSFPIGSRAAPRRTEEDSRPAEVRLNDLRSFKPEPADEDFRRAITAACTPHFDGLPKSDRLAAKRQLYDLTVSRVVNELKEGGGVVSPKVHVVYEHRNADYQLILKLQESVCLAACGDMVRPESASPTPPIQFETYGEAKSEEDEAISYLGMVSWNAYGELVSRDFV